jgi:hypothetical protein
VIAKNAFFFETALYAFFFCVFLGGMGNLARGVSQADGESQEREGAR